MATLIDTFVSVFTSDTDGLREGRNEARRSTDDIVRGMKEADEQANKTSRSVGSMLSRAVAGIAALVASRQALQSVMNRSEEIHLLNQTAEAIGTNVTQLDAFAKAVQDSGGESQAAISSIENMYRALGEAAVNATGSQAQALARSGVQLRDAQGDYRDTIDIMLDLSDAMSNMGGPEAESIAQQLGISDRRTIETMIQGRQELERTMRAHAEYGAVTAEAAERAGKLDSANNKLNQGLGALRDRMVVAVTPAITWVIERLGDLARWVFDNQTVVEGFFIGVAGIVARHFLPAMVSAAGTAWLTIAPFAAMAAVVIAVGAAFALIYDDIRNFINENDSLIGQIAEEYPAIGRVIKGLVAVFSAAFAAISDAVKWLGEQFGMSIGGIGDVIRLLVRMLLGSLDQILKWSEDFVGMFRDAADDVVGIFKWLWGQIQKLLKPITGAFNFVADGIGKFRGWLPGGGSSDDDAPAQPQPESDLVSKIPGQEPTRPQSEPETVSRVPGQAPERPQPESDLVSMIPGRTPERPQPEPESVLRTPVRPPEQPQPELVPMVPGRLLEQPQPQPELVPRMPRRGPDDMSEMLDPIRVQVAGAGSVINEAAASPVNNITRESINNQYRTQRTENRVEIGEITVHTQATDAKGVSEAVGGELREQLRMVNSEFATGVER